MTLKKCSGCGIMHRQDKACHWCGERKPSGWSSGAVLKSATGIAAVALVAVGSWAVREPAADMLAQAFSRSSATVEAGQAVSAVAEQAPVVVAPMTPTQPAQPASPAPDSLMSETADGALASPSDTMSWEPAVARTWVNVRRDAGRGGDVVGVIKPDEKAMLGGESRSGWRQVKSPDMSGWVDSRLFEPDSLRTRG